MERGVLSREEGALEECGNGKAGGDGGAEGRQGVTKVESENEKDTLMNRCGAMNGERGRI